MKIGECIGEGKTGSVFEWGNNEVIKIFQDRNKAIIEAKNAEIINSLGVRAPEFIKIIEIEDKTGLIYERLKGQTMLKLIEPTISSLAHYGRILAGLHLEIHGIKLNIKPNLKRELINKISYSEHIVDKQKLKIIEIIKKLPEGQSLCHYDFHPDNIIMTANGPVIIDWANALVGQQRADVARTSMILKSSALPPKAPKWIQTREYRDELHKTYLYEYTKESEIEIGDIDRWIIPSLAIRIEELMDKEQEEILNLLDEHLKV
jgi:tRNA A-37 threonylcarbamoyl transferase component Bud32